MVGEARDPDGDVGPLDGVTVLDASRVLVGPFCTMQLGDLGADVVKVERPGVGDQTRGWRPPAQGDESAYYLSVNRNKRSVCLNLASEDGREAFRRLARDADVVVENFRVGRMDEWGLGYDDLRAENPGLVYCSLSGYGEWGPDADRPAYDLVLQAEGGLMSITGEPGRPPVRVGVAVVDVAAGMYATQAVLAALLERELGEGTGQKVDVSLLDSEVAWLSYMAQYYFATGDPPGRMGSKHPTIAPYQAVPTADGYVVVAVASEAIWGRFCDAIGRPALAHDDRFAKNDRRVEHRAELDAIVEAAFADLTTDEALDALSAHDVPASAVNDVGDVFDHPQVEARGMEWTLRHPTAGDLSTAGSPMHFSRTPVTGRRHPPLLGEHTREVLREAGYDDAEIAELFAADAVA